MLCVLDLEFNSIVFVLKQSISSHLAFISTTSSSRVRGTSLPPVHGCNMGSASSSQRGGKVTQSQTVVRESTNANTPKDTPQVVRSHWVQCACAQPFSGC